VTFDTGTGGKRDGTAEALPINPSSSTATNFQLFPAAESLLSTYASGKEKQVCNVWKINTIEYTYLHLTLRV
jgi:hypothetical protein